MRTSTLTAVALITLGAWAGGQAAGAGGDPGRKEAGRLRGVGLLILDPRDPPERVKERLRLFLDQVRPNVPEALRQDSNREKLEALLAADWKPGENLPDLDLVFHPDMTVDQIHRYLEMTPVARESAAVCPAACPLRDPGGTTIHIHLTRPTDSGGDSIILLHLYMSDGSEPVASQDQIDATVEMGKGLTERYGDYGYDRRPLTRLFGVRVVAGEPMVDRDSMGQEPDIND